MSIFGLIIATVVHAIYNYFMSGEQIAGLGGIGGVIVTLVIGVGLFQMYVLREKRYITDYGSIASQIQRGKQLREVRHH